MGDELGLIGIKCELNVNMAKFGGDSNLLWLLLLFFPNLGTESIYPRFTAHFELSYWYFSFFYIAHMFSKAP